MMKEITVSAAADQILKVTGFVNSRLEKLNCPEECRIQIDIALDEILSNIIRYAYGPEGGPVTVRFQAGDAPPGAVITVTDRGVPFNPLESEPPDLSTPLRSRPVGGLGLFVVRSTMDEVSYRYEDGRNILTVRKNLPVN